jgi:hypothetical protein
MTYWLELPHVDEDGYKVAAECTYLVLNNKLERVPVKFTIELEWVKDDEDPSESCYVARLITSKGSVITFEVDEDGEGADSTGGSYLIESFYLSELVGQDAAEDFYCGCFDIYLELSVNDSKGTVSLFPALYQSIKYYLVL